MIDLKQYGYVETEKPPDGLLPGRVVEFRRDRYSVITEHGELDAVLKGSFVHDAIVRADLPCVGDFVLLRNSRVRIKKEREITNMNITKGRLTIRNATPDDAQQLCIWWNDGEIMAHAGFPNGTGENPGFVYIKDDY